MLRTKYAADPIVLALIDSAYYIAQDNDDMNQSDQKAGDELYDLKEKSVESLAQVLDDVSELDEILTYLKNHKDELEEQLPEAIMFFDRIKTEVQLLYTKMEK